MSAILSADDLNDFISPGLACIKPVESLPQKSTASAENAYEVTTEDKVQPENQAPTQISLTDCLACSGCVTSAEAVLISLQSHAEVLNTLDAHRPAPLIVAQDGDISASREIEPNERIFVASVSPQVRASLAATYGISERKAGYMIDQLLRGPQGLRSGGKHGNGFTWVIDTDVLRQMVLTLAAQEVTESLSAPSTCKESGRYSSPKRPILSSACPGWICYAEKTHPHVLPHLSRLKSPQALAGTFVKSILSRALGIAPSQIWHLAVMPCFDKKLEASREELTEAAWNKSSNTSQSPVRDVDCVITSRELLMLASSRNISLPSLPLKPLALAYAPHFPDSTIDSFLFSGTHTSKQSLAYGTSGGYLYYILSSHQERHPGSRIEAQRGRNSDVVEYSLVSESNETIMKAARYYGFRNIQNLVRKMKPARASRLPGAKRGTTGSGVNGSSGLDYAFVEVMACPGGCTNGGGQIRLEDAREANSNMHNASIDDSTIMTQKNTTYEQREWLSRVDEAYFSAESDSEDQAKSAATLTSLHHMEIRTHNILQHWTNMTGARLEDLVYTTFRKVESDVGKDKNANDTTRVAELAGKIGGGW
ncbi:iron-sulfur cluster assembly associated protein Nar1, putative [Talaromyces stipitatus ATCC 10500]|uniref:Cytosolic Fe-S cluster assembly factor NAR1 n=1 Tax=Talaromyces stipitatus (strain ATCC 10500 / CBS 375.48 / QM 6759 / NRRL 1006) TaxID=441959 RepID=B8LWE1_TALSN|nr:iron-sulfur cluster assembly associated protein Nar1, putative [Talaromyces stipitatus ATCC 10500]EED24251.1 iron-sulfur cluster assembly associated protein Nar1, putative [Talaromyces stipitatus ATCC 10500]